jgi:phosphatidylglycerol---prolipoprotein diacylglyceryl transferase
MIPSFAWYDVQLGPVTVHVWGIFVALGVMTALLLVHREARRVGPAARHWVDHALAIIIAGFIGARLGHVLLYEPAQYFADPLEVLRVWHGGMSSLGGFVVAAGYGVWRLRRAQIDVHRFAEACALALPVGWMIGRVGCFLIHDHPGTLTHFVLAVREPGALGEAGWGRHDLGLYDALVAAVVALVVFMLRTRRWLRGRHMLVVVAIYAVARFFLDFLRATDLSSADVRYGGLTPAQYGCMIALVFVMVFWYKKEATK